MDILATLSKYLPKDSPLWSILRAGDDAMQENEQRFRSEQEQFRSKRDERRKQWAERHPPRP